MTHRSTTIAAALLLLFCVGSRQAAASPLPSKTGFVTVNGIKLHYLDWGGSGATILFLPGFNDAAHVYDDFAPRFTDRFHVIGLTRRGVGESDKPKSGYDTSTRVEDMREFLDALGVQTVILIGHSMAGDELTLFATRYPQRVAKIVYLDAAYDRTPEGWLAGLTDPTNRPGMMQRMRMEALSLPGASDIHVEKMPPPEEWRFSLPPRGQFSLFAKTTQKFRPRHSPFTLRPRTSIIPHTGCQTMRTRASAQKQRRGGRRKDTPSCASQLSNFAGRFLTARL
jgi:pimeloyl-ACP methyl ester carboxylesterase